MQKWEIAGISFLPVVECLLAINTAAGSGGEPLVAEALLIHILAGVMTVAALVRALLDKRKAAS